MAGLQRADDHLLRVLLHQHKDRAGRRPGRN